MMFNRRAQYKGLEIVGEVKVLMWWIPVRRFTNASDAVKWLGYGKEE